MASGAAVAVEDGAVTRASSHPVVAEPLACRGGAEGSEAGGEERGEVVWMGMGRWGPQWKEGGRSAQGRGSSTYVSSYRHTTGGSAMEVEMEMQHMRLQPSSRQAYCKQLVLQNALKDPGNTAGGLGFRTGVASCLGGMIPLKAQS